MQPRGSKFEKESSLGKNKYNLLQTITRHLYITKHEHKHIIGTDFAMQSITTKQIKQLCKKAI